MASGAGIDMYQRVKEIEREVNRLKLALLRSRATEGQERGAVSLEGVWKGTDITEDDIRAARDSLFPQGYNL
ncbi:MAG: hypothetical protein ACOC58_04865 [Chloroflexota bacterium]